MNKNGLEQQSIRPADRPRLNALLTNPVLMGEYLYQTATNMLIIKSLIFTSSSSKNISIAKAMQRFFSLNKQKLILFLFHHLDNGLVLIFLLTVFVAICCYALEGKKIL